VEKTGNPSDRSRFFTRGRLIGGGLATLICTAAAVIGVWQTQRHDDAARAAARSEAKASRTAGLQVKQTILEFVAHQRRAGAVSEADERTSERNLAFNQLSPQARSGMRERMRQAHLQTDDPRVLWRDDPVSWLRIGVPNRPVSGSRATIEMPSPLVVRRARSGCKELDGVWVLHRASRWLIDRFPGDRSGQTRHCDQATLAASWGRKAGSAGIGGDETDASVPRWARAHLQVLEPLSVDGFPTDNGTAGAQTWSSSNTLDVHTRTAWRSRGLSGLLDHGPCRAAADTTAQLRYVFPTTVRLVRIMLFNGQNEDVAAGLTGVDAFLRAARVCEADLVLTGGSSPQHDATTRTFPLVFPDAPGGLRVTEDFGAARELTVVVRSWYPGQDARVRSHVALSGIQFFALAPGSPAPTEPAPLPAAPAHLYSRVPFTIGNPGIRLCAVYAGTAPDPRCGAQKRAVLDNLIAAVSAPGGGTGRHRGRRARLGLTQRVSSPSPMSRA
jgi:hypothetical protein